VYAKYGAKERELKEKYKKEYLAYRDTDMKNDILGDAR
jgi:hypothetical protein